MFDKDIEILAVKVERAVDNALDLLKEDIDSKTPEDTKELLENNVRSDVERVGNIIG